MRIGASLLVLHGSCARRGLVLQMTDPHRAVAHSHALLLRGKAVFIALTAAIPKPVALANNSHKVPASGPVGAGAMGTGQQAHDRVRYQKEWNREKCEGHKAQRSRGFKPPS